MPHVFIDLSMYFVFGICPNISHRITIVVITIKCVQLIIFLENILGEKSWVEETCESINEPQCPAG